MNAETEITVIDFAGLGGPVYVGRPKGELTRRKYNLDAIDQNISAKVVVKVPESTYSINSSYFLGLFGPSIRALGNRDAFFKKYNFQAPDRFIERIEGYVARALHEQPNLF